VATREGYERNVIHSDGTLLISHGQLPGGSDYTLKMAEKRDKPWMHVDASRVSVDAAVELVKAWISGRRVRVLNMRRSTKEFYADEHNNF
jgi:hypothetical protein